MIVRERLLDGWERGFGSPTGRLLGLAGIAYRGLVAARDGLYAGRVQRSRALGCPVV